jgi:hypothetical protein
VAWVAALTKTPAELIAIDGRRRGGARTSNSSPTSRKKRAFRYETSADETVDGDQGRIETRRATVLHDVAWLQERHDWPGLKGVVIIDSTREIGARTERETRYNLTSSAWRAERLGPTELCQGEKRPLPCVLRS